jgi:hypothetical protein
MKENGKVRVYEKVCQSQCESSVVGTDAKEG